jgi:nucleoid-associated protein YgaU
VWLSATAASAGAGVVARPGVASALAREPVPALDAALAEVASCVLLGCAVWLWLTTTLGVAEALRAQPSHARSGVRRWVLVACGVAAVSGSLPAAVAAPHHHAPVATALPYPDRAVAPSRPEPHPANRTVLVRPGDSLWVIAARDLGADPTDAEITARWHALYAANQARIGHDPDRIEPGLRLLLPRKDPS